MKLRTHQEDVIRETRESISRGYKKPLIFAPCSFGKTIVAAEIARLASDKGNKVLFLVHRRLLALQTKDKFDDYGLHSSIIMSGYDTDFSASVMITTVQTYSRRLKLDSPEANIFFHDAAIIFCDEAHLGISKTYQQIYKYYQDRIIIGLTGSPARGDGRPLGDVFDNMVKSIGIKELTDKGFLAPVRYFAADAPNLSGVQTTAGDYNKGQLQNKMNKVKLVGDVIQNWLKLAENRPTIVFATGVKHSIHLKEQFERCGIPAAHLEARSPHEERMDVLRRFRDGEITVVTNCQLFTEGYDADFVKAICIARPTKSYPLWVQMAGRGQRIFEGKEDVFLFDFGGNIERHGFLEDSIEWTLDGKEKAWSKPKSKEKEKRPLRCTVCHHVFQEGDVCPQCGSPCKKFGKKVESTDDELQEIKARKATSEEKRIWFGMFKWQCRAKGYKEGWASWKFKERYKVWPNKYRDVSPIEPNQEFKNWLIYQSIKAAKQKEKAEKSIINHIDINNPPAFMGFRGIDV